MILRGILEQSLGGFITLRGYASIKDLAMISIKNDKYQRELNEEHRNEIASYLNDGEYLFFPEIILSYQLDSSRDNFNLSGDDKIIDKTAEAKNKSISLSANSVKAYTAQNEVRGKEFTRQITININDEFIKDNPVFERIDGNHRLTAVDSLPQDKNPLAPFCIILFTDNEISNKQKSILFHKINSKGLPLTSEENIKSIFDNQELSDDELKKTLGENYVLARNLAVKLDVDYVPNFKDILDISKRSLCLEIIGFLKKMKHKFADKTQVNKQNLKKSFSIANQLYDDFPNLLNADISAQKQLLLSVIYFIFKSNLTKYLAEQFIKWVQNNHLYKIKNIDPESIIRIFEEIHDNQIKIFMAMPYYSVHDVNDCNNALSTVIKELKADNPHLNLHDHPIMSTHSNTKPKDVITDIFNKIRECSIFIADLATNNSNVLYEYGYARGLDKPCILLCNDNQIASDNDKPKSDYQNDLRFHFSGTEDLKGNLKMEIICVLKSMGYQVV